MIPMAHFLVAYAHRPGVSLREAIDDVRKALSDAKCDGKLILRGREGDPWIQVEGFWPQDAPRVGRALARGSGAIAVEEETVSGCMSYSRFAGGKLAFRFSRCEGARELKGKPLEWERGLFSQEGDGAVFSLAPIAKHLKLPGFDGEAPGYWLIEEAYRGD